MVFQQRVAQSPLHTRRTQDSLEARRSHPATCFLELASTLTLRRLWTLTATPPFPTLRGELTNSMAHILFTPPFILTIGHSHLPSSPLSHPSVSSSLSPAHPGSKASPPNRTMPPRRYRFFRNMQRATHAPWTSRKASSRSGNRRGCLHLTGILSSHQINLRPNHVLHRPARPLRRMLPVFFSAQDGAEVYWRGVDLSHLILAFP
ncbi:hypothetical protein B0H19DRAFT_686082 [Mycena capillaripes]|nr:hypothetical protein B0H19DRAFT_686082 [Mycena capillaripes]